MCKDFGFQFDNSYLMLPKCLYTCIGPTPVSSPEMVIFNHDLAQTMGLDFSTMDSEEAAALFSGNTLLKHGGYFAQAYAGHQFGHYTVLGDGRAIMLGEHLTPDKKR